MLLLRDCDARVSLCVSGFAFVCCGCAGSLLDFFIGTRNSYTSCK